MPRKDLQICNLLWTSALLGKHKQLEKILHQLRWFRASNHLQCFVQTCEIGEKSGIEGMEKILHQFLPDNFSYRICINSLGKKSDIEGMEKILEEMEVQPQIVVDWNTYPVVANIYIKAGLNLMANSMLKKSEQKLEKRNGVCYNHLISFHCALKNKEEMWRLWALQKENCRRFNNRDYATMIQALVKLEEVGRRSGELVKDWESSGNSFDFRVLNALEARGERSFFTGSRGGKELKLGRDSGTAEAA